MEMRFTPEEEAFRIEVREFIAANLPADIRRKVSLGLRLEREDFVRWQDILARRGWYAVNWPQEYGGPGWSAVQKYLFMQEYGAQPCPPLVQFGVNMVGPVIYTYGSPAQKARFLPRILNNQDWWCQGYSEPGSGSDLASLKTTAVREGDHYVVNGQKTWTTLGQHANMIFCLVRTSREGKPQQGISFLLIDMQTPGVEVRPIITLEGEHEVNEVFFTDVKVPVENLVGEENKGWTYAKYLLTYERTNIAGVGYSMAHLDKLKAVAERSLCNGRPLAEDPLFAARLARVEIDLQNMEITNLRVLASVAAGGAPGVESSMLKIRGSEIRQEILSLTRRAMGVYAAPFLPEALEETPAEPLGDPAAAMAAALYFNSRKLSIFGGSNEIQKNIIAKMMLGL